MDYCVVRAFIERRKNQPFALIAWHFNPSVVLVEGGGAGVLVDRKCRL